MKIDWYFDFVSPFAYLQQSQFKFLPNYVTVNFKPILFGGILNHWGQKGPAELPSKRKFTYRQTLWLAREYKIPFIMPPAHPFNPLSVLRLSIVLECKQNPIQEIFNFIWAEGKSIEGASPLIELAEKLGVENVEEQIASPQIKEQLKQNTDDAINLGVFGIPTFVVNKELFWGFDTNKMLLDFLENPSLFKDSEMRRISNLPESAQRKQIK